MQGTEPGEYDVTGNNLEILAIVPKSEADQWLAQSGKPGRSKEVALSEMKDDLLKYLREAARGEILITRHGKPAGV